MKRSKKSKRITVLVIVLAVVCAATFVLTRYEEKQEEIKRSDTIILEIPADTVETLSWEYTENLKDKETDDNKETDKTEEEAEAEEADEKYECNFTFHKEDDTWLYDDDESFPVSDDKVSDILSNFEAFGVSFIIQNVEDYGQYGLDNPECIIHIGTAEQEYEIKLGEFSKMDEQRYVDIGDGNVYLVSNDPVDFLEEKLSGMIENDANLSYDSVSGITFSGSENYTVIKNENSTDTYNEDDIYFAELDGKNFPLDTENVKTYLKTVTNLDFASYVTYNATDEELESYGMDEPELSVTINYTVYDEDENEISDSYVLHISQNPEELAAYEAAEAEMENAVADSDDAEDSEEDELPQVTKYVRVGDSQIVYKLSDEDYDILAAAAYNDLRHREVIWADFDKVTQIDITLENETHTIISEPDEDSEEDDETERIWYYGEEKLNIYSIKSSLTDLSADSFTDESPSDREEISLTVYLDDENFPQVDIHLYRYDGSFCLAAVDGESVSLVARDDVMCLVEAVQEIVLGKN